MTDSSRHCDHNLSMSIAERLLEVCEWWEQRGQCGVADDDEIDRILVVVHGIAQDLKHFRALGPQAAHLLGQSMIAVGLCPADIDQLVGSLLKRARSRLD